MDVVIPAVLLADMTQWVTRVVPARPAVPILAGVSLRCDHDQLVVEASDLDWTFRSTSRCEVGASGRVIVAGKLFAEVARALPIADAHCWTTDTELILECGGLEYRFTRLPDQEYPDVDAIPDSLGTVDGPSFAEAVAQVAVAAGRDELLPVFTGVQVSVDGDQLTLGATDRYRMSTTCLSWSPSVSVEPAELLVPAKLLAEICRPGTVPDTYDLGWKGRVADLQQIGLRATIGDESREVRGRLLSGRLPSLQPILAVDTPLTLWLRTEELKAAVRRVRLTAEQRSPIVLSIGPDDHVVVSSASAGRASGKAIVGLLAFDGELQEPQRLGFNPQYLLDALNTYSTEFVQMRVSQKYLTAILHGATSGFEPTDDDHSHVVKMVQLPKME